jgi:hypothetical protein
VAFGEDGTAVSCALAVLPTVSEKKTAPPGFGTSVCWFEGPQGVLYCHTFLSAYVVFCTQTAGRSTLPSPSTLLVNHTFHSSSQPLFLAAELTSGRYITNNECSRVQWSPNAVCLNLTTCWSRQVETRHRYWLREKT